MRRFKALAAAPVLAAVLVAGLTSGCWNRREVNEVALVSAAAVDRTPNGQIRVTLQIGKPRALGGEGMVQSGQMAVFTVAAEGGTVVEAIRRLNHQLPRPPGWEHNNAIVFGEALAREGLADVLDFFVRFHRSRLDQWILVARGDAARVLDAEFELEPNSGLAFRQIYRNAWISTGEVPRVRLHEFVVALFEDVTSPLAAIVEPAATDDDRNGPPRYRIGGAAVFRQDRLVGYLTDRELRGVQWMRGALRHTVLRVPCQKTAGDGISIDVLNTVAKLAPEWHQGNLPAVRVPIAVAARLGGQMCREDLSSPEALDALGKRAAGVIAREIESTMGKLQGELGADPVGVGEAIYRTFPARWPSLRKRWDEVYARIQVIPEVTVTITQTGTTMGKPMPGGPVGQ